MVRISMVVLMALATVTVAEVPEDQGFHGNSLIASARERGKPSRRSFIGASHREDPATEGADGGAGDSENVARMAALASEMAAKQTDQSTKAGEMAAVAGISIADVVQKTKSAATAGKAGDAGLIAADSLQLASDKASGAADARVQILEAKEEQTIAQAAWQVALDAETKAKQDAANAAMTARKVETDFEYKDKEMTQAQADYDQASQTLRDCKTSKTEKATTEYEARKADEDAQRRVDEAQKKFDDAVEKQNATSKSLSDAQDLLTATMGEEVTLAGHLSAAQSEGARKASEATTAANNRLAGKEALEVKSKIFDKLDVEASKKEQEATNAKDAANAANPATSGTATEVEVLEA